MNRKILSCLLLVLVLPLPASGQDAAKHARIKELMTMTGASQMGMQFASAMSNAIVGTLKQARPDIPERALKILDQELVAIVQENIDVPGGLIDRVVPVYDKYFTAAEIDELIAFYRTPLGRKAISTMPAVMQESMAAGQAWGQSLSPEINRRLEAALKREGIQLPGK